MDGVTLCQEEHDVTHGSHTTSGHELDVERSEDVDDTLLVSHRLVMLDLPDLHDIVADGVPLRSSVRTADQQHYDAEGDCDAQVDPGLFR